MDYTRGFCSVPDLLENRARCCRKGYHSTKLGDLDDLDRVADISKSFRFIEVLVFCLYWARIKSFKFRAKLSISPGVIVNRIYVLFNESNTRHSRRGGGGVNNRRCI